MDRSYSPVSPYARAYESHARSYAGKGQAFADYLLKEDKKTLRVGLIVGFVILFLVTMYLTNLSRREFTADELNGSWKHMAGLVSWTKSSSGKMFITFLWLLFAVSLVAMLYVGSRWSSKHKL
jgi:hypothetical protein